MRVLHVMNELRPSGMERMLVSAAPYFRNLGVTGEVIAFGQSNPFKQELELSGYRVHEVRRSIFSLVGATQYRYVVRNGNFDVVHIHSEKSYPVAALVAHHCGVPVVRTIHNVFVPRSAPRRAYRLLVARLVDPLVAKLISCSSDVHENEEAAGRSSDVIWNWVDDRFRTKAISNDLAPRLLLVGNCSSVKHHELALMAAHRLGVPVVHLGDESAQEPAETESLQMLASAGLLLHRGVADPIDFATRGSVFAMPSRHEGMPVSLAEALCLGLRALVSDSPGLRWSFAEPAVHVAREEADWPIMLRSLFFETDRCWGSPLCDFSASRGAADYSAVYESCKTGGRQP